MAVIFFLTSAAMFTFKVFTSQAKYSVMEACVCVSNEKAVEHAFEVL